MHFIYYNFIETPYKETVWRKDIAKIAFQNIDEIEENNSNLYNKYDIL